jgi:hypothetical protein
MRFQYAGRTCDTSDMDEFPTDDENIFVYVAPRRAGVFVGIVERGVGELVHRADDAEVRWLARRFGIPRLLAEVGTEGPAGA